MRNKMVNSLALPGYHVSRRANFSNKRKPAGKKAQVLAVSQNSCGSRWWSSVDGAVPKPPLTSAPVTSIAGYSFRTF